VRSFSIVSLFPAPRSFSAACQLRSQQVIGMRTEQRADLQASASSVHVFRVGDRGAADYARSNE
jgi:hypothetical protein